MGICGGAGVTCSPTDTGPLLAIDLFFSGVIHRFYRSEPVGGGAGDRGV